MREAGRRNHRFDFGSAQSQKCVVCESASDVNQLACGGLRRREEGPQTDIRYSCLYNSIIWDRSVWPLCKSVLRGHKKKLSRGVKEEHFICLRIVRKWDLGGYRPAILITDVCMEICFLPHWVLFANDCAHNFGMYMPRI